MSVNISSSSNSSLDSVLFYCKVSVFISIAFTIIRFVLLLPLSTLVLYLGYQRCRQQRSINTTSHSDIFTYHSAAMELIFYFGCTLFFWGSSTKMIEVGYFLVNITVFGQGFLHVLTCVERYLAVVHPITYLGLRKAGGVRIRNISIGCVWVLSFGLTFIITMKNEDLTSTMYFCILSISSVVVSFCSLSVLYVLIRPRPGDVGGSRERVDQSKLRAFLTVMNITGVLWLWFVGTLIAFALGLSPLLSHSDICLLKSSAVWFNLPSTLVLPLLYLHRAGKLPGYKHSNGSAE